MQPQQGNFTRKREGQRQRVNPFLWPSSCSSEPTALCRLEDVDFQLLTPDCSVEKTLCEREEVTHWLLLFVNL